MAIQLPGHVDLNQAALQLDQGLQQVQTRKMQLVFDIGMQAGAALATLKATKSQLKSANKTLEGEIVQLRSAHVAELNAYVDGFAAKIKMVSEQVNAIAAKLDLYKEKYKHHHLSSVDMQKIFTLQKTISAVKCDDLRQYPEDGVHPQPTQEEVVPASVALTRWKEDPSLQSLLAQTFQDHEEMEAQLAPIRVLNRDLAGKKARMIDFHGKLVKELKGKEEQFLMTRIIEPIRLTFKQVNWEKLATANPAIYTPLCDYFIAAQYTQLDQAALNRRVKRIKDSLEELVTLH